MLLGVFHRFRILCIEKLRTCGFRNIVLLFTFQIDNLSTSLESTNDKLKTMEEVNEDYR